MQLEDTLKINELKRRREGLLENISKWKTDEVSADPMVFYQNADLTFELAEQFLRELNAYDKIESNYNDIFYLAPNILDFLLLLRDTMLVTVKRNQYEKDDRGISAFLSEDIDEIFRKATSESLNVFKKAAITPAEVKKLSHQTSPVSEIIDQIEQLERQLKKTYRSHDKINEIRLNLESFNREVNLQYNKQVRTIADISNAIEELENNIEKAIASNTKENLENIQQTIQEEIKILERYQSLESFEIIRYQDDNAVSIPVSTNNGALAVKSINVRSEISKWFSSLVYPHIVELENKRDLTLDKSIDVFNNIKVKVARMLIDEDENEYEIGRSGIKNELSKLKNEHLKPLEDEEKENTAKINAHFGEELLASSVYDQEHAFLPFGTTNQFADLSRTAQKRMADNIKTYRNTGFDWIKNLASRYLEVEKTSYNVFIKNKLAVNKDDERLSLFLKKGYLGKSFTIERKDITEEVASTFEVWDAGFHNSVLLYGDSGVGKSTILGMLGQEFVNREIINLKWDEEIVVRNRQFEKSKDLGELIRKIYNYSSGRRPIIMIDDLSSWSDDDTSLYQNITTLFDYIKKYGNDMFFIVSCNDQLKERIDVFENLSKVFTIMIPVGRMSNANIKKALNLRSNALPELGLNDIDHKNNIGDILRISKGNIGHAMIEYCRTFSKSYEANLKSQDFTELVNEHDTLLKYVLCHDVITVSKSLDKLSVSDQRMMKEEFHFLLGHKILIENKRDQLKVNPLLIHSVEKSLN